MSKKMKIKAEYIGQRLTVYRSTYEWTFTVTEAHTNDFDYFNTIGLGYLFEPKKPKVDEPTKEV